jgi:hypothetical protein
MSSALQTVQELRVRTVRVPLQEPHRTASGVVAESPLVLTKCPGRVPTETEREYFELTTNSPR